MTLRPETVRERLALVRSNLEALRDAGAHILSGRFKDAPKEYGDSAPRLVDRGVLDPALGTRLERVSGFRNVLVHQYGAVDYALVHEKLEHCRVIGLAPDLVRNPGEKHCGVRMWLVRERPVVQVDGAPVPAHPIARHAHYPLHENHPRVLGIAQYHHLPAGRRAPPRDPGGREGHAHAVGELRDEHPIADQQARQHAAGGHEERIEVGPAEAERGQDAEDRFDDAPDLCPSCGGRRIGERAVHLVDNVFHAVAIRSRC